MFKPYEGDKPYLFISYAHKNTETVMPVLEMLADSGVRIWYDAGIEAGTEWPESIAYHLYHAEAVIAFVTDDFIASRNCRREIAFSKQIGKSVTLSRPKDAPPLDYRDSKTVFFEDIPTLYYSSSPTDPTLVAELSLLRDTQTCRGVIASFEEEILALYQRAADGGNRKAQAILNTRTIGGELSDTPKTWWLEAANKGNTYAMNQVAYCYLHDSVGPMSFRSTANPARVAVGLYWYKKSSSAGDSDAPYELGNIYQNGYFGIPADMEAALRWYATAASRGDIASRMELEDFLAEHPERKGRLFS